VGSYFLLGISLFLTGVLYEKNYIRHTKLLPMKSQPIDEMSTENLRKNYKIIKLITAILFGALIVMAASAIYKTYTKGFGAFSILPLAFLPAFITNIINFKKIKKELIARGENLGHS
jgi:hypothetical protein